MDGSILIVDDVATNRIVLRAKLGAAFYRPLLASTGAEALRIARKEIPDLILLDLGLPDISGIDVLQTLRADPVTRDIPVVVLSATGDRELRLKALAAGADDVFSKPCDDGLLLARVRNLLRNHQELQQHSSPRLGEAYYNLAEEPMVFAAPGIIAIVTDRKNVAMGLRRELSPLVRDQILQISPMDVLRGLQEDQTIADLYIIDSASTSEHGWIRLLSDLRSRAQTRHAGICVLEDRDDDTAPESPRRITQTIAFDLDTNDVLRIEMQADEIAARLRAVIRRKRRADQRRETVQDELRQALIDPLTGLHNRRFGMARLGALIPQHGEEGKCIAILLADLDCFKSVNDRFGHAAGDQVLVEIGRRLSQGLRQDDLLVRYGGEEFLIALPDTGLAEAGVIAERLRRVLECHPIKVADGPLIEVTSSIGLATLRPRENLTKPEIETMLNAVIAAADEALLAAKAAGRNTVTATHRQVA